jgi:hypothetical protein
VTAVTAEDLERVLVEELERPVRVVYGRARRTPVRAEVQGGVLVVRVNAMFADAPAEVQLSLARWLRSGRRARRACTLLDDWIDERLARLHSEEPKTASLQTDGRAHDLARLAGAVVAEHFGPDFEAPPVTWGRRGRSRSRHTLRLGSYDYHARVVRIHSVLDQPSVPAWFVQFVLFHELLHAALDDVPEPGTRKLHHGPEFRRRERAHPDYERAIEWERRNVDLMIASARTGRPIPGQEGRSAPAVRRAVDYVQRLLFD